MALGAQAGGGGLIPERNILKEKFSQLLGWERNKRRERTLVTIGFYALVAAVLTIPVSAWLRDWINPWSMPVLFFLLLAPVCFVTQRWNFRESQRALVRLDQALHLDARAVTAWEILAHEEKKPAELLVVKEAEERLRSMDASALFPRELTWQAYVLGPLLIVWFALLWFDIGSQHGSTAQPSRPKSIAEKLGEFSRELQEKAKLEGLRETLNVSRELEKVAKKRLEGETADDQFQKDVAAAGKKITDTTRGMPVNDKFSSASESSERLRDLKTELEVAKDGLSSSETHQGGRETAELYERLGGLPHLKQEIDKGFPSSDTLRGSELKSFLDRLEKEVTRELDRRTLLETQQFLEQLLKEGQGQMGDSKLQVAGPEKGDFPGEGEKQKTTSNLPGTEPGQKEDLSNSLPSFQPGAATHLKGLLGEGKSAGMVFKGKPSSGKSEISQDELVTTYRRQAEAELNTERMPEALKDTIKNYFLSLGMEERK